jgi:hypothetical protein
MSRLFPVSYGVGVMLVPDPLNPVRDERIVRPARGRKETRRARV